MRTIQVEDLADIALGASLLGSGGGGDPYMGRLEAMAAIRKYGPVTMYDPEEIPDDWTVAKVSGVGAPSVYLEKGRNGSEYLRAIEAFQKVGRKLDALIPVECGGLNSMVPIAAAAVAGLPMINADGMGRAFPGLQQDTFCLADVEGCPYVITDDKGNVSILYTANADWTEKIGRDICAVTGGAVLAISAPMTGAQIKQFAVPRTIDLAQRLGRTIREVSDVEASSPEEHFLAQTGAVRLFRGKISDVLRETRGGYNFGRAEMEGILEDKGHTAAVEFQNENIFAEVDGTIAATVPDLICLVDSDTFRPVTTENLKYGKRVLVVALRCWDAWRSPAGVNLVGPGWFGLECPYVPVEERLGIELPSLFQ
ncbi:MAG: DUF917 domain-containing protein [Eggerthellales bacterium]|nr:DUF917 domain-containing protein [Eggerthellales bacterium]